MKKRFYDEKENKYRFYVAQDQLFIDLNLIQFGWEHCDSLHSYGPAVRNHFLFHYVIDGKGTLDTSGKTFTITKGQGFLLCPGQTSMYTADEDDPWYYAWIEFDGMQARQMMTLAGMSESQPIYTPVDSSDMEIEKLLLKIVEEAEKSPIRLVGMAMILIDRIVETSKTRIHEEKKKLRDFYMREAINFIDGNYMRDISVEEIADSSGLNRSYFSRIFKDTFGESPQRFLLKYRMYKASELLKNTKMPVAEVGASVGYDNQLHFSRAFRNIFGISPKNYRDNHRLSQNN